MTKDIQFKPFEMRDLCMFEPIDDQDFWELMEWNIRLKDRNFVSVIGVSGVVLAIVGMTYIRRGVAEVGVFRSKSYDKKKGLYARFMKFLLDEYLPENFDIVRLELYIDIDWPKADRWASFLGFEYEGICKCYDIEKKDHKQYARIY